MDSEIDMLWEWKELGRVIHGVGSFLQAGCMKLLKYQKISSSYLSLRVVFMTSGELDVV